MIDLIINNIEIAEVRSYRDASNFLGQRGDKGTLTFDSDRTRGELILRFTSQEKKMQADFNNHARLFLDDIRIPTSSGFAVVRSYDDAVQFMEKWGCPEYISFDHDLGDADEHSGLDVAKWMIERDLNEDGKFIPVNFSYKVHSANPPGAANIHGLLKNYLEQR